MMPLFRLDLDCYDSRDPAKPGARVRTYARGYRLDTALSKIKAVRIAQDGTVSDGINPWPGADNLPPGPHTARSLPEWRVIEAVRVVNPEPDTTPHLLRCGCCAMTRDEALAEADKALTWRRTTNTEALVVYTAGDIRPGAGYRIEGRARLIHGSSRRDWSLWRGAHCIGRPSRLAEAKRDAVVDHAERLLRES